MEREVTRNERELRERYYLAFDEPKVPPRPDTPDAPSDAGPSTDFTVGIMSAQIRVRF